jgi:pimeloyl-ACP methyl ester carboxylesterase
VRHLDRGATRIAYADHGHGPAVLLTHGYGATSQMWQPQIAALADRCRLIVWDIRGHGATDSPQDPSAYSEAAAVGDMAAILDASGVERAIVGGLSLGGYLSLAFHLAYPDRVRALALFDTGPGYRNDEGRKRWNAMAESYARALEERGIGALGAGTEVRQSEHHSAAGLARAARGILAQRDSRVIDSLATIGVPTLVLWGERDADFVRPGEYMAAKIPGARRVVIPGAGHAANLDRPDEFNAALWSFVEAVGP